MDGSRSTTTASVFCAQTRACEPQQFSKAAIVHYSCTIVS